MQFSMIAQMHCHAPDKKGRFLGEIAPSMSGHDKMSLTKRLLQLSDMRLKYFFNCLLLLLSITNKKLDAKNELKTQVCFGLKIGS